MSEGKSKFEKQVHILFMVTCVAALVIWYFVIQSFRHSNGPTVESVQANNSPEVEADDDDKPASPPTRVSANLPLALEANPKQVATIILAGDGGDLQPFMRDLLKYHINILSHDTSIYFMGDNIYPNGLPSENRGYEGAKKKLMAQIDLVKDSKAQAVFIPGNHDWDNSEQFGWENIKREAALVTSILGPKSFYPKGGCPGPVQVQLDKRVRVIVIDSQWWLHQYEKPSEANKGCKIWTKEGVLKELERLLASIKDKIPTFVLQHHPLVSTGPHARNGGCYQDFACPQYAEMREKFLAILDKYKPLVCGAGHDHSQQLFASDTGCKFFVVSGGLTNLSSVVPDQDTLFAMETFGFAKFDFFKDGGIRVRFIIPDTKEVAGRVAFEKWLENGTLPISEKG